MSLDPSTKNTLILKAMNSIQITKKSLDFKENLMRLFSQGEQLLILDWCVKGLAKSQPPTASTTSVIASTVKAITTTSSAVSSQASSIVLPKGSMMIKVKTLTGKEIEVMVDPDETIETLKKRVLQKEGIPVDQQRLIYAGRQLEDSGRLGPTYNIQRGAITHLCLKLRGGMYHTSSARSNFHPNFTMKISQKEMNLEGEIEVHTGLKISELKDVIKDCFKNSNTFQNNFYAIFCNDIPLATTTEDMTLGDLGLSPELPLSDRSLILKMVKPQEPEEPEDPSSSTTDSS